MPNEPITQRVSASGWRARHAYVMAVIFLVVGLAIGYLFRGSASPASPAADAKAVAPAGNAGGHMPSLEEMKQMADKRAAPVLEKLKGDPNNASLINQVAGIYKATHQFKDAAAYYEKALQVDPANVVTRTELASCLYYNGDADAAIVQLQQALQYDPKDANSLFNLGMIKWQGKKDSKGAVEVWQRLLKSNPQLSADRKATVQKLMADAQMEGKS